MATISNCDTDTTEARECFAFTLLLSGFDDITDEIENALHDAGCDDATLGIHAGTPYLAFDREADSLQDAIQSAIKAVERCGVGIEVVRVIPPGADTIETANAYLKMRRQLLTHLSKADLDRLGERVDEVLLAAVRADANALLHAFAQKK